MKPKCNCLNVSDVRGCCLPNDKTWKHCPVKTWSFVYTDYFNNIMRKNNNNEKYTIAFANKIYEDNKDTLSPHITKAEFRKALYLTFTD